MTEKVLGVVAAFVGAVGAFTYATSIECDLLWDSIHHSFIVTGTNGGQGGFREHLQLSFVEDVSDSAGGAATVERKDFSWCKILKFGLVDGIAIRVYLQNGCALPASVTSVCNKDEVVFCTLNK